MTMTMTMTTALKNEAKEAKEEKAYNAEDTELHPSTTLDRLDNRSLRKNKQRVDVPSGARSLTSAIRYPDKCAKVCAVV